MNNLKRENQKELMSTNELIAYLSVTRSTIFHWTRNGIIKPRKLGGKNFYKKSEIDEALESSTKKP